MIERIVLTFVIVAIGLAAFYVLQLVQRRQLSAEVDRHGIPFILYFRSDSCAACSTQKRYLDELQQSTTVRIDTIDAVHQPEVAARFNVMTLPTTIVVDGGGTVKQINYGLADATKLARQMGM